MKKHFENKKEEHKEVVGEREKNKEQATRDAFDIKRAEKDLQKKIYLNI